MSVKKKLYVVCLIFLIEIIAVLIFGKLMTPIQNGTSAEFWKSACGVDIATEERGQMDGIYGDYPPRDDWYIYYIQGFHQQFLYRVPRFEAVPDYPEVLQKIAKFADEQSAKPVLRLAHSVIEQNRSQGEVSPDILLGLIRDARMLQMKKESEKMYQYALISEQQFSESWNRMQNYWLNIVFECIFFMSLTLFAFWPYLRNKDVWRTSVHLGLIPLLLILPFYLGYCSWTFTSVGPSGGALYPWVIACFHGIPIWTPIDQWFLENLPKLLEPLSQTMGGMLSFSGGRALGLIAALLIGIVIFAFSWVISNYLRFRSSEKQIATSKSEELQNK